jgi:hypothetical protein
MDLFFMQAKIHLSKLQASIAAGHDLLAVAVAVF